MEVFEPVQGVRNQEVADLATTEVENVGSPVRMLATQRIRILIQGSAVETSKRPVVLWEVGGNPVKDDANSGLVEFVDKVAEIVGCAETRGGCVVRGHLIAPRPAEGVLR
ncbi:Uncharacterised protein [Chlamydia trachomatis]|nr:Uncharacterised protein [Chlamydia trachomatis]